MAVRLGAGRTPRPWAGRATGPRRAALAVGLSLLLGTAAACSGGGDTNGLEKLPAPQVGTKALEALRTAPSVHVVGVEDDPGSGAPGHYDLVMSGVSTRGTIEEFGQRTQIVKIGDDTYVRRGHAYYDGINESDAGDLLADRWVRLAPSDAAEYSYFTLDKLAASLTDYVAGLTGDVKTEKLGGSRAVRVASPDGTTMWAANTGAPYPLKTTVTGSSTGEITFGDYGAKTTFAPPPDAVDLSKLS